MAYLLTALFSYLVGSSNMAFYLSRLRKVNLRSGGSGNLGASNTVAMMGWWAGVLAGLHDIGKSALCVFLAQKLCPDCAFIGAIAGVASVFGHIFPFYLKFHGGKGFASYLGMTLALNWKLALVLAVVIVIVTFITDYIVVGTTITILAVPTWMGIANQSPILFAILMLATLVIAYVHRMNYVRIYNGTEIGLRSASKGEHRAK